jgi:hypothetical protein
MAGAVADVPLSVSSDEDLQGFIMAFEWSGARGSGEALVLRDGAGEPLADAELVVPRVEADFMVLSVVMDIDGQGGEVIPTGDDIEVATAQIRCIGPATGTRETSVRFVDDAHASVEGGPELKNSLAQGGLSITQAEGLELRDGAFVCMGEPDTGSGEIMFACGGPLGDDGLPTTLSADLETSVPLTFYYKAPATNPEGLSNEIQGLSMSVGYNCDLNADPTSFDIAGGALEATNAEFVHIEVDNRGSGQDGDSCQFTFGVLVDAVAPFDGRTLPLTSGFEKLFTIDMFIEPDAPCDECMRIKFRDGHNGNEGRPVKNLVSVEFQSRSPITMDCEICALGQPVFQRGDCNLSGMGNMAVDIADAAAMVGFFFLTGEAAFDAPCEDACDANDDGMLDASDVVFALEFLFVPGSPRPPRPGPDRAGVDPTLDNLGCEGAPRRCP